MQLFLIILGMTVVTFIPRLLPVFIIDKLKLPAWANNWLKAIPYAALGALIFPGILTVEANKPIIGLVGGLVALILALTKLQIIYVVLGSIFSVMLLKALIL